MEQLTEQELTINEVIKKMLWCECQVIPGDYGMLTIAISNDLTYHHIMEVVFKQVDFSCIKYAFKLNPQLGLFQVMQNDERIRLNKQFHIEEGYRLFRLIDEDGIDHFIASETITARTDTVFYYNRQKLLPGQRIAGWVVK